MVKTVILITVLVSSVAFVNTDNAVKFYQEKDYHEPYELSNTEVQALVDLSDKNHFRSVLDEILIPRVVGTRNHKKVGDFIVNQMRDLGWHVSEDTFKERTPVFGMLNFRNIIARLNPEADRYLVLACHYDSKYMRENSFVGATDSAVPCAMMINLAKVMSQLLNSKKDSNLSLMFIFFDGEEAFRLWGPNDSIYGAKHLAKQWNTNKYKDGSNQLQRMDMLVLLDLLGTPDPVFYSYFPSTERWYVRLANAEQRLSGLNQLQGYSKGKEDQNYFRLKSSRALIEDDHIPFLKRNVNILHVIPSPFPKEWHTVEDNLAALDFNTIDNLNKIFRIFVAEYLQIQP